MHMNKIANRYDSDTFGFPYSGSLEADHVDFSTGRGSLLKASFHVLTEMGLARNIFAYLVGVFWSFFVLLQCIRLIIFKRSQFFAKKDRSFPPAVLKDPEFGEDSYAEVSKVHTHTCCFAADRRSRVMH